MKKYFTILTLMVASLTSAVASAKDVQVYVKGMVCSFCAQGIKKKFSADEAVSKVDVSLEKHLVSLSLKEGKELPDARITSVLKDAGYTVEKIERN